MKRSHCKNCEDELTEDNIVSSGRKREDGSVIPRPECRTCFTLYEASLRKSRYKYNVDIVCTKEQAIERAKNFPIIPLIPNLNTNMRWMG